MYAQHVSEDQKRDRRSAGGPEDANAADRDEDHNTRLATTKRRRLLVSVRGIMTLTALIAVGFSLNYEWHRYRRLERKLASYQGRADFYNFTREIQLSRFRYLLSKAENTVSTFAELRSEPDRALPVALTTRDGVEALEALREAEYLDQRHKYYMKLIAMIREARAKFWAPEPLEPQAPARPPSFSQLR